MSDFSINYVEPGISVIHHRGLPLDVMWQTGRSKTLLVCFHGGWPMNRTLPAFVGIGLSEYANVDLLSLADAMLHVDRPLKIGWHLGDKDRNLQRYHHHIIQQVIAQGEYKRVIFAAGSAGGFAAMIHSALVPGSFVIPMNPQTRIKTYYEVQWRRFLKTFFGKDGCTLDMLPDDRYFSVFPLYSGKFQNYVIYHQNQTDCFHYKHHAVPFIEHVTGQPWTKRDLGKYQITDQLELHIGNWGEGHVISRPLLFKQVKALRV